MKKTKVYRAKFELVEECNSLTSAKELVKKLKLKNNNSNKDYKIQ
jgi:hypothetical protein